MHGMQEVSGSIPLFSTKKALYFVGSMVLFFFVPAKRSRVHRSPCRRASDTPDLHNSRHLPCRFNRGFRGQHGAGPTAPAPAWQALAEAPAVRQRGRRRSKSHAAFFKNSIFLIVFHSLSVKALKKSFPSFLNGSAIRLKASSTRS